MDETSNACDETEEQETDYSNMNECKSVLPWNAVEPSTSIASCEDCSRAFSNINELSVHRISVHHDDLVNINGPKSPIIRSCAKCRAKLTSEAAYNIHMLSHARKHQRNKLSGSIEPVQCKYCGETYLSNDWSGHCNTVHRVTKKEQLEKKSVDCKICLRPFVRLSALCNHVQKQHPEKLEEIAETEGCLVLWVCRECGLEFSNESGLVQHYSDKHGRRPLNTSGLKVLQPLTETCECGYIMTSPIEDSVHEILLHHERSLSFNCPACDRTCSSLADLQIHVTSYHSFFSAGLENQCVFCEEVFPYFHALKNHLEKEHDIVTGEFEANSEFKDSNVVSLVSEVTPLSSVQETSNDSTLRCASCNCCFETSEIMFDHVCQESSDQIVQEQESSRLICPTCSKSFPTKMNLHNHFKRRHLGLTRRFICSYCGKSLKGPLALRSHEDRLHRGVRSFQCPDCPQAFTTASILRKHSEQHMPERPVHTCGVCGRSFTTASGYSRHLATHDGNKSFVCSLEHCQKAFYTKSELRRHTKFHTQDFNHVCDVCGHKFVSPCELRKHWTKHTYERPFRCHVCSATYSRRDDKVRHMRRAHHLRIKRVYGPKTTEVYVQEDQCSQ